MYSLGKLQTPKATLILMPSCPSPRGHPKTYSSNLWARTRDAHLEKDGLAGGAELHDVAQLGGVDVLLGHGAEEVHPPLVDAQDQLGGQQADGVLYPLHREEGRIACSIAPAQAGMQAMKPVNWRA